VFPVPQTKWGATCAVIINRSLTPKLFVKDDVALRDVEGVAPEWLVIIKRVFIDPEAMANFLRRLS